VRDAEDVDPDTRARKKERRVNEDEQMEVEYDGELFEKLYTFSSECLTSVWYRGYAYNGW